MKRNRFWKLTISAIALATTDYSLNTQVLDNWKNLSDPNEFINHIEPAPDGSLWLATDAGVYHLVLSSPLHVGQV